MRRHRLCAVLALLALLATAPAAWASDPGETRSPRTAFAALWDRVTASLAALWEGLVLTPSSADEPAEPSSTSPPPEPPDSEPQGDYGGTLDPNG